MFRGVSALNLDAKGRMAIPTRYRERLVESCASQLVITVDKDRCLLIYPEPVWEEIEQKLKALPSFNRAARNLQRLYIGHAHDLEMDAQGRILLPTELRKFANLQKRVALVGQGDRFELWDEETWNRNRDEWLEEVDLNDLDLPEELESLSI
ncbi:division/cell wall cluster transcriptional repressor MraZ [endosymbiont of Ridgeia piscesae]|nr:division/cell wall cluster transcriptional repressor MraZ [endosymbiont of Ridgeia piscesae]